MSRSLEYVFTIYGGDDRLRDFVKDEKRAVTWVFFFVLEVLIPSSSFYGSNVSDIQLYMILIVIRQRETFEGKKRIGVVKGGTR